MVVAVDEGGVVGVQRGVPFLQGGVVVVQSGVVGFQAEDAGDAGQVDAFADEGGDAAEPDDVVVAVAAGASTWTWTGYRPPTGTGCCGW